MGKFIAGIILGVLGVAAGAYVYVHYGYMRMEADRSRRLEQIYMDGAMDRSTDRFAPKVNNPKEANDANLIEGIRLYKSNCAVCHGGPEKPVSGVGEGLYPSAPQFLRDAPDMPENQNYWIIKHGVARTGMPAWGKLLSEDEIWKLTTFLSKMEDVEKLSPSVQAEWKSGGQTEMGAQQNHGTPPAQPPAMPHPAGHAHSR